MLHLPNLPNAGYATDNQKFVSDAIQEFMRGVERDRLRLVTIVVEGLEKWRTVARSAFGSKAPHDIIDTMYEYFRLQAADGTPWQAELLRHRQNQAKTKEIVRAMWPHLLEQKDQLEIMAKWSPVQRAGWHG